MRSSRAPLFTDRSMPTVRVLPKRRLGACPARLRSARAPPKGGSYASPVSMLALAGATAVLAQAGSAVAGTVLAQGGTDAGYDGPPPLSAWTLLTRWEVSPVLLVMLVVVVGLHLLAAARPRPAAGTAALSSADAGRVRHAALPRLPRRVDHGPGHADRGRLVRVAAPAVESGPARGPAHGRWPVVGLR